MLGCNNKSPGNEAYQTVFHLSKLDNVLPLCGSQSINCKQKNI